MIEKAQELTMQDFTDANVFMSALVDDSKHGRASDGLTFTHSSPDEFMPSNYRSNILLHDSVSREENNVRFTVYRNGITEFVPMKLKLKYELEFKAL